MANFLPVPTSLFAFLASLLLTLTLHVQQGGGGGGVHAFGLPPPHNGKNTASVRSSMNASSKENSSASSASSNTASIGTTTTSAVGTDIAPVMPKQTTPPVQQESQTALSKEREPEPSTIPEHNLWDPSQAAFRTEDRFMTPSMVGYKYREIIPASPQPTVSTDSTLTPASGAAPQAEAKEGTWDPSEWHRHMESTDFMDQSMMGYQPRQVIHDANPPTVPAKLDSVDRFFSPSMLNPMQRPVLGIYSDEGVGFERGGASMDGGYGWVGSNTHTSPFPSDYTQQ